MPEPELPVRNGHRSLPAICPHEGGKRAVYLANDYMKWISQQGIGRTRELAFIVPEALLKPKAIFQGLRLDHPEIDEDDWFCYVARPAFAYDWKRGERRDAWAGQVMLICVTSDWVLYHWRWYMASSDNPNLPVDYETRFGQRMI